VLPFCPFIRDYIRRHPVYLDLVPDGRRAGFQLAPASDQPDRPAQIRTVPTAGPPEGDVDGTGSTAPGEDNPR
jgi:hypothetical protein